MRFLTSLWPAWPFSRASSLFSTLVCVLRSARNDIPCSDFFPVRKLTVWKKRQTNKLAKHHEESTMGDHWQGILPRLGVEDGQEGFSEEMVLKLCMKGEQEFAMWRWWGRAFQFGEYLVQRQRGVRKHAEFRELQIQLSMLAAVYGRRQDEAGRWTGARYEYDCVLLSLGFFMEAVGTT